jgi:kynurenine formamidase/carbon monoxide dehydrogenase subunit G
MINVDGIYSLDAPRESVWPRIFDPNSLMNLIPGCQGLEQISPNEYHGKIRIGFASISGEYTTFVRILEQTPPAHCSFEGEVSGPTGIAKGNALFNLEEVNGKTTIHYQTNALITGALASLSPRFIEGAVKTLVQLGLSTLNKQIKKTAHDSPAWIDLDKLYLEKSMIGGVMKIVDLTVPIGEDTISPPSVNQQLILTSYHRGPGFWQASKVEMVLHTGSHVDFLRHVQPDGETAIDIPLERVFGDARVVDLSFVGPNHGITVDDLEKHAAQVKEGDIVLVRTDWTEKQWGHFPTYYLESPYCTAEAAQWLIDRGSRAIGFDCFSEYCARLPDFTSEDFIIHKIILENGALLMQQMTNLSKLPTDRTFMFFAPFIKMRGAEGSPARFFAILD